ncbi:hypothetical protein T03_7125 [Trichinella britovi]|uniref:Uncharacterized protein n=1 Tax=Trichinella britovi TaxID=45882 RepID=A0A0V1DCN9_TRIBR|nr:hypothetical protein T03_7125 [Trichinella britovi]
MADVPELHLVPNRCEIWSNSVDKEGCGGAIWTNLDVTSAVLKKRSAEETKPIPAIYDEEASAASAKPCTSGHFPIFKQLGWILCEQSSMRPTTAMVTYLTAWKNRQRDLAVIMGIRGTWNRSRRRNRPIGCRGTGKVRARAIVRRRTISTATPVASRSAFATEQFPADKALLACRRTEADAMRE